LVYKHHRDDHMLENSADDNCSKTWHDALLPLQILYSVWWTLTHVMCLLPWGTQLAASLALDLPNQD
jgi:hypothetical protein